METWMWAAIVAGVVLLVLLVVAVIRHRHRARAAARSEELRNRFGNEYDRTVDARGREEAETALEDRASRYQQAPVRPLDERTRTDLHRRWAAIQAEYVDDPRVAVARANRLFRTVLERRGVPSDRLDDRVTAAAFVRPELAEQYRLAHDVYVEIEAERAGPEHEHDERRAFLVYRELVLALLDRPETVPGHDGNGSRPAAAASHN